MSSWKTVSSLFHTLRSFFSTSSYLINSSLIILRSRFYSRSFSIYLLYCPTWFSSMILLLRRFSSYNAGRFTFFSSPATIEHLFRFSSPNGFILLLNSITYRSHISKLHFHRPIVINLSVLFGSKAMKSRITNDRNYVSVSPVNELELLKQECMLQKELLQLGEQK